jgi:hypothetical protein
MVGRMKIAALYLHRPSDEYCVLYRNKKRRDLKVAYYIVRAGTSPKCMGDPSDSPCIEKVVSSCPKLTPSTLAPPVLFRNCLHWNSCHNAAIIVVFDTVVETFRSMHSPPGATRLSNCLCDMEGFMGFSCLHNKRTIAKIWVLEDYEREVC